MGARLQGMEPLPIGVEPAAPATLTRRPPPITGDSGGYGSSWDRPLRRPHPLQQRSFLLGVIVEMRKVMWPTPEQPRPQRRDLPF